jgi:hypothetical protein
LGGGLNVNDRNVQALRVLLEEGIEAVLGNSGHAFIGDCGRLAEWLIHNGGVTVPYALSDADARKLLYRALPTGLSESETEREDGYWVRDGLCRIALGEPVAGEKGGA